jgi:hypothetical protein
MLGLIDPSPSVWQHTMTEGRTILECYGFQHADTDIPAFRVKQGEHIAILVPWHEDRDWTTFMEVLAGHSDCSAVSAQCPTYVIPCGGFEEDVSAAPTVANILQRHGVEHERAAAIEGDLSLEPSKPYDHLAFTPRIELSLEIASYKGAELIVFSTAGLDPMGLQKVSQRIRAFKTPCATIDIRSASVSEALERFSPNTRLIRLE